MQLVILNPVVDLGLGQPQDILSGIGRGLTTANIQEIKTGGSLVQSLFVTGGITKVAAGVLLDQRSGFGIVFLLADDLLHCYALLSGRKYRLNYIVIPLEKQVKNKELADYSQYLFDNLSFAARAS